MRTTRSLTTSAVVGTGLVVAGLGLGTAAAASVEPTLVDGNPSCEQLLPGSTEHKLDFAPADGQYTDGTITVTITNTGSSELSWTSDLDVDAVIMKGGPMANVYAYPGAADLADQGLTTPLNENNDQPYGISHVSFCYGLDVPGDEPGDQPDEPGDQPDEPGDQPDEPGEPGDQPDEPADELDDEPADEPVTEVLSQELERPAELPRTGSGIALLTGVGASLAAVGEALRRFGRR